MIRRFIVRSLIFTILAIAVVAGVAAALSMANASIYDMRGAHILFLGNSHIETAVNPDSLGSEVRNFARSAEVAEYAYAKLRLAHRYNPALDTVYFGLDNQMIYHDGAEFIQFHPSFYSALTLQDYAAVARYGDFGCVTHHLSHPFDIGKSFEYIMLGMSPDWDMRDSRSVGGYLEIRRYNLHKAMAQREKDAALAPGAGDESRIALYFIDRMYEYCTDNDIALIFLVTPQHRLTPYDKENYRHVMSSRYPDVPAIDLMDAAMRDSCYSDLHHLNVRGAAAFSRFLRDSVMHRPLEKGIKVYIDSII